MTDHRPRSGNESVETDWLGALPFTWKRAPLRHVARIVNGGTPSPDPLNWDGPIAWATPVDLGSVNGGFLGKTGRTLTVKGLLGGSAAVGPGSVLVSTRAPIGYVALSTELTAFNQGCKALIPNRSLIPGFLLYILQAAKSEMMRRGQGTTFLEIASGALGSMHAPVPTEEDQKRLVSFLDRETAEIDAFIADQEELIALLAERRAATISRIVSKGLDPTSKTRESGVRWLGDVPVHWQAGNIRRFATMKTGHTPSRSKGEYWLNCSIPWFTLADVWQLRRGQTYLGKTSTEISLLGLQNSAAELLPAGTVVLSRTASVGFSGIMPQPMATSQDYWNWICKPSLLPKYLWYQFLAMRPFFGSLVHGSTHKTIYQADAAALGIAAPPVDEQELIIGYLDRETAELDAAIADAREAIALSKERRAALISAAVTGKINVRGVA